MAQFLVREAGNSYPESVMNTENTMIGSHTDFPPTAASGESMPGAPALPSRLRVVWMVLDEVWRAFAAGSMAERDHHHPDSAHTLYQDDPHLDR